MSPLPEAGPAGRQVVRPVARQGAPSARLTPRYQLALDQRERGVGAGQTRVRTRTVGTGSEQQGNRTQYKYRKSLASSHGLVLKVENCVLHWLELAMWAIVGPATTSAILSLLSVQTGNSTTAVTQRSRVELVINRQAIARRP